MPRFVDYGGYIFFVLRISQYESVILAVFHEPLLGRHVFLIVYQRIGPSCGIRIYDIHGKSAFMLARPRISRIRFKQRVLEHARVLDSQKLNSDTIGLLNTVDITNLGNNGKISYTIVSPHEANIQEKKISIKSPIAQALLGKKVGDVVEVKVPAGTMQLRIDDIKL